MKPSEDNQTWGWFVAAAVFTFCFCVSWGLAPSNRGLLASWVQTGAVTATGILIVWYAWETRRMGLATVRMADLTHTQLAFEHEADLHAWAEPRPGSKLGAGLALVVANAGRGPATDIEVAAAWGDYNGKHSGPTAAVSVLRENAEDGGPAPDWYLPILLPKKTVEGWALALTGEGLLRIRWRQPDADQYHYRCSRVTMVEEGRSYAFDRVTSSEQCGQAGRWQGCHSCTWRVDGGGCPVTTGDADATAVP